jgi:hypothetical protein
VHSSSGLASTVAEVSSVSGELVSARAVSEVAVSEVATSIGEPESTRSMERLPLDGSGLQPVVAVRAREKASVIQSGEARRRIMADTPDFVDQRGHPGSSPPEELREDAIEHRIRTEDTRGGTRDANVRVGSPFEPPIRNNSVPFAEDRAWRGASDEPFGAR